MSVKHFDEILTILGTGKWNIFLYCAFGLCGFMIPSFVLLGAFLTPALEFQCITPETSDVVDKQECNYVTIGEDEVNNGTVDLQQKCSRWKFSDDLFPTTLTEEFELVCENAYLRPTFQTAYMVGSFVSAPVNGFLSDRFGRKTLFGAGAILLTASMLISSYLTNFISLLAFRFLAGVAHSPLMHTGYIICMEACEPRMRSIVGILLSLPWAFGTMWFGAVGYLVNDWRWMIRVLLIPGLVFLTCFFWLIDESPRWLIVSGDHYAALKILKKAARWNKATLPSDDELLQKMRETQKSSIATTAESSINLNYSKNWKEKLKHFSNYIYILYKTPEIRRRSLLMYIVFLVASTVFYGLSLNAANFKLDPYMYMVVNGLMEVPAYSLTVPVVMKAGRIPPTIAAYFICGVAIIALTFMKDTKWLIYTFAMTAKFCISAAYQIIYLIASEVFPTEVRLQGLGTSNFISRIGTILAPFITDSLGPLYPWSPSVLFGVISICAGIAAYFIPETTNKHLPETISQLEAEAKSLKKRNLMEDGSIEEKESVAKKEEQVF